MITLIARFQPTNTYEREELNSIIDSYIFPAGCYFIGVFRSKQNHHTYLDAEFIGPPEYISELYDTIHDIFVEVERSQLIYKKLQVFEYTDSTSSEE